MFQLTDISEKVGVSKPEVPPHQTSQMKGPCLGHLAALEHRKQSEGWAALPRVSVGQRQGIAMEAGTCGDIRGQEPHHIDGDDRWED